jgi:hypothetical protein
MKYIDYPLKCIGQTEYFHTRYKEHIQAMRNNNNSNLGYSSHILNTGLTYRTITDTMDFIRTRGKENI